MVPEELRGRGLEVLLGKIDNCDETFLNGTLVGKTGELPPREVAPDTRKTNRTYTLPPETLNYGQQNNPLAVRVFDAGAGGGMLGLAGCRTLPLQSPIPAC